MQTTWGFSTPNSFDRNDKIWFFHVMTGRKRKLENIKYVAVQKGIQCSHVLYFRLAVLFEKGLWIFVFKKGDDKSGRKRGDSQSLHLLAFLADKTV